MRKNSAKIVKKVKDFILKNNLIKNKDKVMIALSGGSDSVCLFHILNSLKNDMGFSLYAFHLNHNIRKEAKRDEKFVLDLCKIYDVPLFLESEDMPALHEDSSLGLEEISRKKRYELIYKIMKENHIDKTATAHHLLDHSESMILNMTRGSGIRGLRGISVKNDNIIRPILNLTKEEILCYIEENELEYVTDITNFDTDYSRNNIRHNILPHLEEINDNVYNHFFELSSVAEEVDDLLNELASKVDIIKEDRKVYISLKDYYSLHVAVKKQILFNMLNQLGIKKDINSKAINNIVDLIEKNNTSFEINLINNIVAKRRYDKLYFEYLSKDKRESIYLEVDNKNKFEIKYNDIIIKLEKKDILDKNSEDKYVDYDKIRGKLFLRTRKDGDKFSPFGLNGSKKLKKYFIDKKIPKEDRDFIPLLVDEENIIAVIGYDINNKYRINENTKNILSINYKTMRGKHERRH